MLPDRLRKTQIFHGLPIQVWSISESIKDVPQVLLDGYELSSTYIASSKPGWGSKILDQTLPQRLCKIQIFHGLPNQVWSISESIMDVPRFYLMGTSNCPIIIRICCVFLLSIFMPLILSLK